MNYPELKDDWSLAKLCDEFTIAQKRAFVLHHVTGTPEYRPDIDSLPIGQLNHYFLHFAAFYEFDPKEILQLCSTTDKVTQT